MTSHDNGLGHPCKIPDHRTEDFWFIPMHPSFYKQRPATKPTFSENPNDRPGQITGSVRMYDCHGQLMMVPSKMSTVVCSHPDHPENDVWSVDPPFETADHLDPDDGFSWRTDAKYVDLLWRTQLADREAALEAEQLQVLRDAAKEREEEERKEQEKKDEEKANKILDEVIGSRDNKNEAEQAASDQGNKVRSRNMVGTPVDKDALAEALANTEETDELPGSERVGKFDALIEKVLGRPGVWHKVDGTVVSANSAAGTINRRYGQDTISFNGAEHQITARPRGGTGGRKDLYVRADVLDGEVENADGIRGNVALTGEEGLPPS